MTREFVTLRSYDKLKQDFTNVVLQGTYAPSDNFCTSRGLTALADGLRTLATWNIVKLTKDQAENVTAVVIRKYRD